MTVFRYLIRFKDAAGTVLFGEAGGPSAADALLGKTVPIYQGTSPWDPNLKATGENAVVKELLSPVEDASVIHCVGLNYKAHLTESGVRHCYLLRTGALLTICSWLLLSIHWSSPSFQTLSPALLTTYRLIPRLQSLTTRYASFVFLFSPILLLSTAY